MSGERERLEYLRGELRAGRIAWGELLELQGLVDHIEPGDVELLEAAGVPEDVANGGRCPACGDMPWVCTCEPAEPRTLGDDLGDGDAATLEQAPSPRWPSVRERFQVHPDGSVWLRPSPFSSWRGPLVAIRCDGSEVP